MIFGQINALTCVVQSCTTRQKTSDLSGEKGNKPSRFDATNLLIKRLALHRSATVQSLFGLCPHWCCMHCMKALQPRQSQALCNHQSTCLQAVSSIDNHCNASSTGVLEQSHNQRTTLAQSLTIFHNYLVG